MINLSKSILLVLKFFAAETSVDDDNNILETEIYDVTDVSEGLHGTLQSATLVVVDALCALGFIEVPSCCDEQYSITQSGMNHLHALPSEKI